MRIFALAFPALLYARILEYGFLSDDFDWLLDADFRWRDLLVDVSHRALIWNARPVQKLLLFEGGRWLGMDPLPFRWLALGLFASTCAVLDAWLARLELRAGARLAAVAAFATASVHVKNLLWLSTLHALLFDLLFVSILWVYASSLSDLRRVAVALPLYLLAAGSREAFMAVPVAVLAMLWYRRELRSHRLSLVAVLAMLAHVAVFLAAKASLAGVVPTSHRIGIGAGVVGNLAKLLDAHVLNLPNTAPVAVMLAALALGNLLWRRDRRALLAASIAGAVGAPWLLLVTPDGQPGLDARYLSSAWIGLALGVGAWCSRPAVSPALGWARALAVAALLSGTTAGTLLFEMRDMTPVGRAAGRAGDSLARFCTGSARPELRACLDVPEEQRARAALEIEWITGRGRLYDIVCSSTREPGPMSTAPCVAVDRLGLAQPCDRCLELGGPLAATDGRASADA